tara:strand:- start:3496 stop:5856 length:2361 start_codon:yes stop_codon:yes gene_type:complete
MKNKIFIIILILNQIFFVNKVFSQEIDIQATDIEFLKNQNVTIANNATAIIKKDGIIIKGEKIEYFKDKSFLLIKNGKISTTTENLKIQSKIIEYEIDRSNLYLKGDVEVIDDINNLVMNSNEVNYNLKERKITSFNSSEITDKIYNKYKVDGFEYSINDKIIKFNNLVALDNDGNSFLVDLSYLDLNKKELVAKDVSMKFKLIENSENEPRIKGRSLISNEKNTIVKKGTFTFCKKREKCPPWEMSAEEIRHDKQKKTIYYKNASLKIFDQKVFYFPKFFHPDPTVKRQSGFLIPKFQDNSSAGLSLTLPYFLALAENQDITFTPRFFKDDKFLIQSEFREKNKNSNHIIDISQFISNNENSKGHLFYNFDKNFKTNSFNDVELNIKLEQVTDETYLKANKVESPIINNLSNLTNSLNLQMNNEKVTINTNLDVYEDLTKNDSDKYEYVPNYSLSKMINDNYTFYSNGYYKNYNTNITEKVLINDFEFQSNLKLFDSGLINKKIFSIKNVNSDSTNSSDFKDKTTANIIPTYQTNYTYPLNKETSKYNNLITPKLSLKLSLPSSKDVRKKDRIIGYENIYDLDRLGIAETSEGGISATYGYEFTKIDKSNFDEKMKFGFANNLRFEENKDLPINSNLGDKTSDIVGLFNYKYNDNLKFDYNFSLKNNLNEKNYELFGFEYYLNKFSTKFEYLNRNNSNLKTSYLKNETRYNFNKKNSLIFETSENKEKSFTEFYNLIYQYENDCLRAGIEYNKEYYNDEDLTPSENLFFKITILPFGGFNTPNLK